MTASTARRVSAASSKQGGRAISDKLKAQKNVKKRNRKRCWRNQCRGVGRKIAAQKAKAKAKPKGKPKVCTTTLLPLDTLRKDNQKICSLYRRRCPLMQLQGKYAEENSAEDAGLDPPPGTSCAYHRISIKVDLK